MKIGIVDDHRLLLESYKIILSDFECVLEAYNGLEMINKIGQLDKKNYPDVMIVDINMPEMNGFEAVAWLKSNHPEIKIVVVTLKNEENSILRMIKLGVNSYLTKDTLKPDELIQAIIEVKEKGNFYNTRVAEVIVKSYQNSNLSETEVKIHSLTVREIEVLKLISKEHSSVEIADKLFVSARTVESHVKNMLEKLNIKTRLGLALFAQKNGLLN